ncbi:hypothetical protein [Streptomyces sp. NPDC048436]|uniref:hypothetical protein n=1 Tax=Streptomyces sp. NPDC048436 TaxID=3365550 RepID=UPI0037184DDF
MNSTRRQLIERLGALGPSVHAWPGGLTHRNRTAAGLDKTHTIDAIAVGKHSADDGRIVRVPARVLVMNAAGRGSYARTTPDRFGFPRLRRARAKRARGQHSIATPAGRINVSHQNLRLLQRGDGYAYGTRQESVSPPVRKTG